MIRSTPSSAIRDLPEEAAHRACRPAPPEPFGLDPAITDVMDVVVVWLRSLLPELGEDAPVDRHALWEVSWRLRELTLATGDEPLSEGGGLVLLAFFWWQLDQESGDGVTRAWSDVAA